MPRSGRSGQIGLRKGIAGWLLGMLSAEFACFCQKRMANGVLCSITDRPLGSLRRAWRLQLPFRGVI